MLADIMQLVQTVDVEKMVQEVRDAGDAANLDGMIATVTKKMLGKMQGARDETCVRVTLAEAFAGKRRRRACTGPHAASPPHCGTVPGRARQRRGHPSDSLPAPPRAP